MPSLLPYNSFLYPNEDYFKLFIKRSKTRTLIHMQVLTGVVNTRDIPSTYNILARFLPGILKSKCFNDEKIPFFEEVRETEIGHLFEHILLEYLCQLKITEGADDVVYSGITDWNWYKDPRGLFHITIDSGQDDADIFPIALEKSMTLLNYIMEEGPPSTLN